MRSLNVLHILIITLVVLLSILVILLIFFRDVVVELCCQKFDLESHPERIATRRGIRNTAFDDQEHPGLISERPFSVMEGVELPPTYDEAVKQELFHFPHLQRLRASHLTNTQDDLIQEVRPTSSTEIPLLQQEQSTISSASASRPKNLIASSLALAPLTTIEEEIEERPITVVIDCIGVQAARLVEGCQTTVTLTNGRELATQSKC